jgi:hypothetical protein
MFALMPITFIDGVNEAACESTTTRKAGGLNLHAAGEFSRHSGAGKDKSMSVL